MDAKIDISSKTIEKCLDVAKEFLQKLIGPGLEEAGLLIRENVAMWRFNNQVNILQKANEICERKGITPSPISLKLLCPLMETASLEDAPELQAKWAALLSNMVDSEKNIQNHVFPYILGQLSLSEFALLDASVREKRDRVNRLGEELTSYKESFQRTESKITQRIAEIDGLILNEKELPRNFTTMKKLSQLNAEKREANSELFALKIRGRQLEY